MYVLGPAESRGVTGFDPRFARVNPREVSTKVVHGPREVTIKMNGDKVVSVPQSDLSGSGNLTAKPKIQEAIKGRLV